MRKAEVNGARSNAVRALEGRVRSGPLAPDVGGAAAGAGWARFQGKEAV